MQIPGVPPGLANARPPGRAKLAKAPPPGLTRRENALARGGGGWAQLELINALPNKNSTLGEQMHLFNVFSSLRLPLPKRKGEDMTLTTFWLFVIHYLYF